MRIYLSLSLLALLISFTTAQFWPGGYDALHFYLRSPFPGTTAPGWVYLVTYPLSWLGWPWGWQAIVFLNVWLVGYLAWFLDHQRWWRVFLGLPLWWTIWLGQIEFLPVFGLLIFVLVMYGHLAPRWLGLSWVALLTKPQVGLGLILYQAYWGWKNRSQVTRGDLIQALSIAIGLIGLSLIIWPTWPRYWFQGLRTLHPTWWNASIWPYGLLVVLFSAYIWPRLHQQAHLSTMAAVTLLASPYFALYHGTLLLALKHDWWDIVMTWLPLLISFVSFGSIHWMEWGWIFPLWVWIRNIYLSRKMSGLLS